MTNLHNRRRFLRLAGTGATATLAGCASINPLSDGDDSDGSLTAIVGPDQEDIEALIEAVENEEMDMAEAQQREQELIDDAVEDFETQAEDDSELTIEESTSEHGLYLIGGSPESIVDALRAGPVMTLHGSAAYEQLLERREQRAQQQPQPQPEPESDEGGDDGESDGESDADEGNETDGSEDTDSAEETGSESGEGDGDE